MDARSLMEYVLLLELYTNRFAPSAHPVPNVVLTKASFCIPAFKNAHSILGEPCLQEKIYMQDGTQNGAISPVWSGNCPEDAARIRLSLFMSLLTLIDGPTSSSFHSDGLAPRTSYLTTLECTQANLGQLRAGVRGL